MKIPSPISTRKARLEIVPMIDIMFFLLAAFVLVSLTMVKQLTISVDLPAAIEAAMDHTPDPFSIGVDSEGNVFVGTERVDLPELRQRLESRLQRDPNTAVTISGDTTTTHGAMVSVLEFVRACGVHRVAFAVRTRSNEGAGATPPAND